MWQTGLFSTNILTCHGRKSPGGANNTDVTLTTDRFRASLQCYAALRRLNRDKKDFFYFPQKIFFSNLPAVTPQCGKGKTSITICQVTTARVRCSKGTSGICSRQGEATGSPMWFQRCRTWPTVNSLNVSPSHYNALGKSKQPVCSCVSLPIKRGFFSTVEGILQLFDQVRLSGQPE